MSGRLSNTELRRLATEMAAIGWTWARTGSGHLRWSHPQVREPVFTAATPRANGSHKERQKLNTALRRAREGCEA